MFQAQPGELAILDVEPFSGVPAAGGGTPTSQFSSGFTGNGTVVASLNATSVGVLTNATSVVAVLLNEFWMKRIHAEYAVYSFKYIDFSF